MSKDMILLSMQLLLVALPCSTLNAEPDTKAAVVTVQHLGHTSFVISDQAGTILVTDPFLDGYGSPFPSHLSVDGVVISAIAPDHSAAHQLRGNPVIVAPGRSSAQVGDFQLEGFPVVSAADSGHQTGYVIRVGDVKLVFLGEIDEVMPADTLQLVEDADAVLTGFRPDAPAARQLAASPRLRTLVPVLINPGAEQATLFKGWVQQEADTVRIGPKSPRQVVSLRPLSQATIPAPASGYPIFSETLVELTWPQLKQAANEKALVLVPVGVIEEHGPHLGLGADTYLTSLHCRRLKSALAGLGITALIAPPLYWGIADDTTGIPGSINVRPETMTALITDLCRSLKAWGFNRVVFVNEHGNRNHRRTLLDSLAKVRQELNLDAFCLDAMMTGAAVYQARRSRYNPDYHAGAAETGAMWQEFPAEVDTRLAQRLKPQSQFLPLGYVGDPAGYAQEEALAEYLKQAPEYDARRIVAFFSPEKGTSARNAEVATPAVALDAKARQVIDRYIQAVGGSERLKAIQSQSRSGQLLEENRTIPMQGLWSAEGKWSLSLQQAPDVIERFGFTGTFGWHAERGEVGQLPEPLVVVISLALDPQLALRLDGLFSRLAISAQQRVPESRTEVLEGETTSGVKVRLAFDSETGLLVRFNDTVFEDYREVEGIRYPFVVTVRPGTQARFDRIENNVPLAAAIFEPPKY